MNKEKCFKVNAWTAYIGKLNIIVPTHSQAGNRCISVSWLAVCSCIHCTSKPRTQQLRLPTQILAPGGRNHPALPEGSITGRQLAWRVRLVYTLHQLTRLNSCDCDYVTDTTVYFLATEPHSRV